MMNLTYLEKGYPMKKLTVPNFSVNPKSYLWAEDLYRLADKAESLATELKLDCLFSAQLIDLPYVISNCPHLTPVAQMIDPIQPGRGMGYVLPEALAAAGVQAAFINHAEKPCTLHNISESIKRCKEVGLLSIVATDSIEEAQAVAQLHPDVMVCELTSLIGTGQTADASYMKRSREVIKSISPNTLVHQGAGIHSGQDVYNTILLGADGTGATSGIVCADDPLAMLEEMMRSMAKARDDLRK